MKIIYLFKNICFLSVLGMLQINSAAAGVIVGGTRIIYDSDKREASIPVKNPEKTAPFLMQSWIDNIDENDKEKVPFIITPPLFRLDAGKENILRIVRVGGDLPEDRESVYWANIKSIPASDKEDKNKLLISVKTKIKLIYRPSALKNEAAAAYKKLSFKLADGGVTITNPTPYYISFNMLKVSGIEVEDPGMVAPKSESFIAVKSFSGAEVSWKTINDFGGVTEEMRNKL